MQGQTSKGAIGPRFRDDFTRTGVPVGCLLRVSALYACDKSGETVVMGACSADELMENGR